MSLIEFINHSSILVKSKETSILCDPWYRGYAFNNGWDLLYKQSKDINELDFDYIWISHEHPDHFSIPDLASLKKSKTFLYQRTIDKKVKKWLEGKSHKVIELDDRETIKIGDLKITLYIANNFDSALLFEFKNKQTFLNSNDCILETTNILDTIYKDKGKIDLVANQFSYANWAGNSSDSIFRNDQLNKKIERLEIIYKKLKPKRLLLFASFIYFCHEENFFNNHSGKFKDYISKIEARGIDVILPTPRQIINIEQLDNSDYISQNIEAIKFWDKLKAEIKPILFSNKGTSIETIRNSYNSFFEELWKNNSLKINKTIKNKNFNLRIFVKDLNLIVEIFLFTKKINILNLDENNSIFDLILSAESIVFLLKNKFGRGTIIINSRIEFVYERIHKFFFFFYMRYSNNIGYYFNEKKLSEEKLLNLLDSSILKSLYKIHFEYKSNFINDAKLFK